MQSSTLTPAGVDAAVVHQLFAWMSWGALAIVIGMALVTVWCLRGRREGPGGESQPRSPGTAAALIVGGGIVLPIAVLSALLAVALPTVGALTTTVDVPTVEVQVEAEQWWWRIRYRLPAGGVVELANELRLPRGERAQLWLSSRDVIHSFWVPSLAGKMDMLPGRVTHLALEPTVTGRFRGVCAEFCGAAHARMALVVDVVEPAAFREWLAREAGPAAAPATAEARRGRDVFRQGGCGGCHAVRGTDARGVIGPDLTHVGGRASLAAGTLANAPAVMMRWLAEPGRHKPAVRMPPFHGLGDDRLAALAAYLDALR